MNRENIFIEERELQIARDLAGSVEDENIRNIIGTNSVAVLAAEKFFDSENYQTDSETGLYRLPKVISDINISDLYVNGVYIDVRICGENGQLCIPQKTYETVRPQLYMFIKTDKDISEASLMGFVKPENINPDMLSNGVYTPDDTLLESFLSIESYLSNKEDEYSMDDEEIYDYIDDEYNFAEFYNKLVNSKDARIRLNRALLAQGVYNNLTITPLDDEDTNNVIEPSMLDSVINVQKDDLYDDYSSDNELVEQVPDIADSVEETVEINPVIDDINNSQDNDDLLYQYTTEASPSSSDIIESLDNNAADDANDLNDIAETVTDDFSASESQDDVEIAGENDEQIDTLFESQNDSNIKPRKKSPLPFLLLLVLLTAVGAGGWYFYNNSMPSEDSPQTEDIDKVVSLPERKVSQEDAMPVESVDKTEKIQNKNEGNAISIPVIEQNLDASISVNNLKVSWEVPSGYASNTAANRYLIKLGKIIQLNLKTELLLLSRQPITNKITVEIKFNKDIKKFEASKIVTSSGEQKVDKIILDTVNRALSSDISINTDSFAKLRGNPMLIIRL